MIIEKSIVKTEAIFNEERTHRTLLKKTWDDQLPSATVLMTNPSTADILKIDFTTMYIINNLSELKYGSVQVVNLFSFMTTKLDVKANLDEYINEDNIKQILKSAKETDVFIVAMGKIAETNKRVVPYQQKLFTRLREYQSKVHTISAFDGIECLHPLAPKLRFSWTLVPYEIPITVDESLNNINVKNSKQKGIKR